KPNKYPNRQQKSCEHHAGCQYRNRRMSQPLIQQADHDESSQWQQGYEPYRRVSYHFNLLSMSISVVFNLLYRTVRMARPTATSAAATAIMKKTNTCPAVSPWKVANATSRRFTALSMSSMHMKMMMALRLNNTPMTPMANRAVLSIT